MNKWHKLRENKSIDWRVMNKKSALTLSIGGVLVILIIIIGFVMTGQHKTSSQSSSTKLPKINQAKVMKRVDSEMFDTTQALKYFENPDNYGDNAYVDGTKLGDTASSYAINSSLGHENSDANPAIYLKANEIENLTTKWEKDGHSFVAKGYFVVKDTGKKYPFAFEFNADYMILQEWYGKDIKI
ncbi:hypothetical protein HMPREF0555_0026 [Leuconostoc mesenteroides subsp. cremoris ATCC 19254]|jgi:hypothetical protein|uniref:Uncharacterized protein n=4 Tax=Lactobacillaceae TaxID=33958 RepID=C2KHB0_LEUMC|nr:hypothetical protein HMPREF0555_0026 [Leuconostoc mesenteroides subsp. cremoris ATCC 19254]SPJ44549.1 conserved exported hypothetical protein [Leuconostoc carnosum]